MSLLPTQKTAAKMAIKRMGEPATILEPTGIAENDYGKRVEGNWTPVERGEYVVRIYQEGHHPKSKRYLGGTYRLDTPRILFWWDTAAQKDWRISVGGSVYEIDVMTPYPSHYEASVTSVS